ncbi:hypothetical protein SynRCC2555_01249 [Synechococcus sp. WH 8101]|nr:hypothetical protein SynRCC2555_01249 [Synechococcus sp. WH 8101]
MNDEVLAGQSKNDHCIPEGIVKVVASPATPAMVKTVSCSDV